MQTPSQTPLNGPMLPSTTPTAVSAPPPVNPADMPDKAPAQTPNAPTNAEAPAKPEDKKSTADKVSSVGHILAADVQKGLSYANARRARAEQNLDNM